MKAKSFIFFYQFEIFDDLETVLTLLNMNAAF